MQRLIDADALKQKVNAAYDLYEYESRNDFYRVIDNAPTIDAIPMEWFDKWKIEPIMAQGIARVLYMWRKEQEVKK